MSLECEPCPVGNFLVMFERFADSAVIGTINALSESFHDMPPIEALNYVNEIAVNQSVSALKCALILTQKASLAT